MTDITKISPLPQPPQRADAPDVFAGRADAFVAALLPFREQLNELGGDVQSAVAGNLVNFDGFAGVWSAGTFDAGQVVFHTPSNAFYISLQDGETAEPPAGDWRKIGITSAEDVDYENATSGLAADNVQDAVDANAAAIKEINENSYVVQTVTSFVETQVDISTGTYTDIGLEVFITPKFQNSKIVVMASIDVNQRRDNDSVRGEVALFKNNSVFYEMSMEDDRSTADIRRFNFSHSMFFEELPNTTDEIKYSFKGRCRDTSFSGRIDFQKFGKRSTVVIMEVKQ